MTEPSSSDVLLVLSERPWPQGREGTRARICLERIMARLGCPEAHLLRIREFQTASFVWPTLIEFRLPDPPDEQAHALRVQSSRGALNAEIQCLTGGSSQLLHLSQSRFGDDHDGASLIVSLYSWQPGVAVADRDQSMWEHFAMERREPDYTAVHFNRRDRTLDTAEDFCDFVFEAYVDDPAGMARIYSSPRLERMREHSRLFLDTSTRRLGFGDIQIIGGN